MDLKILDIEFSEAIESYDGAIHRLNLCIAAYESQLKQIFDEISYKTFSDCEQDFEILERIHLKLAKLLYKYNIPLNDRLKFFVREFERIDDLTVKKLWHQKIINGFKWSRLSSSGS